MIFISCTKRSKPDKTDTYAEYSKIIECLCEKTDTSDLKDCTLDVQKDALPEFIKKDAEKILNYKYPDYGGCSFQWLLEQDDDIFSIKDIKLTPKTRKLIEKSNKNSEQLFFIDIFKIGICKELKHACSILGFYYKSKNYPYIHGHDAVVFFEKSGDNWIICHEERMNAY